MEEFGTQYAAETLLPSTSLDVQDELAGVIAKVNPKVYIQMMRSAMLGDFTALLAAVKAPTLVLIGERRHDRAAAGSRISWLPTFRVRRSRSMPAAGHLGCIDNPAAFNAAVGKFLDANR